MLLSTRCALFSGYEANKIPALLRRCRARKHSFAQGDEIEAEGCLGIVLSGRVDVRSHGEKGALLNRIEAGGIFGVSYLFGSVGAGTRILCREAAGILLIESDSAEPLWEEKRVRQNLLSFLTDRICFLNEKIASLTAGDAEGKVAHFLSAKADGEGVVTLDTSYSEWAGSLGLGRASLYRALESLEEKGLIRREKKRITLLSPESKPLFW